MELGNADYQSKLRETNAADGPAGWEFTVIEYVPFAHVVCFILNAPAFLLGFILVLLANLTFLPLFEHLWFPPEWTWVQ